MCFRGRGRSRRVSYIDSTSLLPTADQSRPSDITTNMKPYKERVKSHIMPVSWVPRMKKYEACKAELAKTTLSAPQGLNLDICYRLRHLAEMKYEIKKNGDRLKLIPTIEAIMEAYGSGKLTWHDGLVTYWSGGKMICDGPKPFTWEDFDYYNKLHEGHCRFWVEGVSFSLFFHADFQKFDSGISSTGPVLLLVLRIMLLSKEISRWHHRARRFYTR